MELALSAAAPELRLSELLAALSQGLDLAEAQPIGHALRSCLFGMHLARRVGLPVCDARDLYFAHLLQDLGGPGCGARLYATLGGDDRAALRDLGGIDWSCDLQALRWGLRHAWPGEAWHVRAWRIAALSRRGRTAIARLFHERSMRAAGLIQRLGLGMRVAESVAALDEHWDGGGEPRGARGTAIPVLARIGALARAMESCAAGAGPERALEMARTRSGRWFDPALVGLAESAVPELGRLCGLDERALRAEVRDCEPGGAALLAGPAAVLRVATAFADAVDAQSPWRAGHSSRVAVYAVGMARELGWSSEGTAELRRAALLHDVGLLSVPNHVLDAERPIGEQGWEAVRLHPWYTQKILDTIPGFAATADAAAAHHERLDGRGYHRALRGPQLSPPARALAVADLYDALTTARPFRAAVPSEEAFEILRRDRGVGLCGDSVDALLLSIEADGEASASEAPEAGRRAA